MLHIDPPTASTCHCQQPIAPPPVFVPTVEGMADTMRAQSAWCTEETLQAEGYSLAFQREHRDAAIALATSSFVREQQRPPESPEMLTARMRAAIGEVLPTLAEIKTALRYKKFTPAQIDAHLRKAVGLASLDLASLVKSQ